MLAHVAQPERKCSSSSVGCCGTEPRCLCHGLLFYSICVPLLLCFFASVSSAAALDSTFSLSSARLGSARSLGRPRESESGARLSFSAVRCVLYIRTACASKHNIVYNSWQQCIRQLIGRLTTSQRHRRRLSCLRLYAYCSDRKMSISVSLRRGVEAI